MGVALRGELTPPLRPATSMTPPNLEKFEGVHKLLSQFTRLSCAQSRSNAFSPAINITPPQTPPERPHHRHAQDAAASWSWTASEAASAEAALLPFLVHLAASTDDVDSLTFCLTTAARLDHTPQWGPASGLENCLQPASGMTPLHVASMNGSENCVGVLLRAGALVHMRDALGHTALYYVSAHSSARSFD
jgi:lysophospholipase